MIKKIRKMICFLIVIPISLAGILTGCSSGNTASTSSTTYVPISDTRYFKFSKVSYPDGLAPQDIFPIECNNDNLQDFILVQMAWPATVPPTYKKVYAYKNNGNGQFVEDTANILGSIEMITANKSAFADFNNDGLKDIIIAESGTDMSPWPGGQTKIFIQKSSYGLADETASRIPAASAVTHDLTFADINNDGYLDVYMGNIGAPGQSGITGIPPKLYVNNNTGIFTDVGSNLPNSVINYTERYFSCKFVDIDKNGNIDLVLGGAMNIKDVILLNDGTGKFTYSLKTYSLSRSSGSEAAEWQAVRIETADFNNDGWPDLLISITKGSYTDCRLELLLNNKDDTFTNATANIPQNWISLGSGGVKWIKAPICKDFNNDGLTDIFAYCGGISAKLYINQGNAIFKDSTDWLWTGNKEIASAIANDFDKDGKNDLLLLTWTLDNIIFAKNIQ